jgi:WD40 repeat protein
MKRLLGTVLVGFIAVASLSAQEPKLLGPAGSHTGVVLCLAFSPDGKILASGSADKTIKLWNVASGDHIAARNGHTEDVLSVVFSPDGKTLVSGSLDNTIMLWDVATCKNISIYNKSHGAGTDSVAFSPDGKTLASGGGGNGIKLWDIATGKSTTIRIANSEYAEPRVVFSPDGKILASGGKCIDKITLWQVANNRNLDTFEVGTRDGVASVAFLTQGKTLGAAGVCGWIKLWDVATGKNTATVKRDDVQVRCGAFSPDGKTLVLGTFDKRLELWDVGMIAATGNK